MQHQGMNNQNGRVCRFQSLNLPKVTPPTADEFKYGFPSGGLEAVSHKWWESSGTNDNDDTSVDGGKTGQEKETKTGKSADNGADLILTDGEKHEIETDESRIDPQPQDQETSLLLRVRKEAKEEGRKALKLGIYRGYSKNSLGRRERRLLSRVFGYALSNQWSSDSSLS